MLDRRYVDVLSRKYALTHLGQILVHENVQNLRDMQKYL